MSVWTDDLAALNAAQEDEARHDRYLERVDRMIDHTPAADLPVELGAIYAEAVE